MAPFPCRTMSLPLLRSRSRHRRAVASERRSPVESMRAIRSRLRSPVGYRGFGCRRRAAASSSVRTSGILNACRFPLILPPGVRLLPIRRTLSPALHPSTPRVKRKRTYAQGKSSVEKRLASRLDDGRRGPAKTSPPGPAEGVLGGLQLISVRPVPDGVPNRSTSGLPWVPARYHSFCSRRA